MELTVKLRQAIKEYKAGDAMAFNALYEESHKYVYTCIYRVMSGNDNVQDAVGDIMQDTYVEISKYIFQLEDEEKFLSWAGTIANRKCFAYLKKNKKYVLLAEEDTTFETLSDDDNIIPEEVMQSREKQRLVRDIIDKELTEMQKLCVIAYYYNEQKQSEIARELGIPENTVKTNLSRAKAKIKAGVLDLEKNTGTRLYSATPLLLLLLREDILSCVVPQKITEGILTTVSSIAAGTAAAGVTTASATAVGTAGATVAAGGTEGVATATGVKAVLGKLSALSLKAKLLGSAAAVAVVAVLGVGAAMAAKEKEPEVWIEDSIPTEVTKEPEPTKVPEVTEVPEPTVAPQETLTLTPTPTLAPLEVKKSEIFEETKWEVRLRDIARINMSSYKYFDIHDFDGDQIPELLLYSEELEEYMYVSYDKENDKHMWHSCWEPLSYVPDSLTVLNYKIGYLDGVDGFLILYDVVWKEQDGPPMMCYVFLEGLQEYLTTGGTDPYHVDRMELLYPVYNDTDASGEITTTKYQVNVNNGEEIYDLTLEEVERRWGEMEAGMVEFRYTDAEPEAINWRITEFKLYGNDTKELWTKEQMAADLGIPTEEELESVRFLAQNFTAGHREEELAGKRFVAQGQEGLYVPTELPTGYADYCGISEASVDGSLCVAKGSYVLGSYDEDKYGTEPMYSKAYPFIMEVEKDENSPFGYRLMRIEYEEEAQSDLSDFILEWIMTYESCIERACVEEWQMTENFSLAPKTMTAVQRMNFMAWSHRLRSYAFDARYDFQIDIGTFSRDMLQMTGELIPKNEIDTFFDKLGENGYSYNGTEYKDGKVNLHVGLKVSCENGTEERYELAHEEYEFLDSQRFVSADGELINSISRVIDAGDRLIVYGVNERQGVPFVMYLNKAWTEMEYRLDYVYYFVSQSSLENNQ